MFQGLLAASESAIRYLETPIVPIRHIGPTRWRNPKLSNNKYADCKAMARKKPRLSLARDMAKMRDWKPRYA